MSRIFVETNATNMEYKFKSLATGIELTAVLSESSGILLNGFKFSPVPNGTKGKCLKANTFKDVQGYLKSVGINRPDVTNLEITVSETDYDFFLQFLDTAKAAAEQAHQKVIDAAPKAWVVEFDGVNLDGDYCPITVKVIQYAITGTGKVPVIIRAFSKESITAAEARQMLELRGLTIDWVNPYGRFYCTEEAAREVIKKADKKASAIREEKERAESEEKQRIEAAFNQAKATGKPVLIGHRIGRSQYYDPGVESSTCEVYRYAMPDGTIEIKIQHHY